MSIVLKKGRHGCKIVAPSFGDLRVYGRVARRAQARINMSSTSLRSSHTWAVRIIYKWELKVRTDRVSGPKSCNGDELSHYFQTIKSTSAASLDVRKWWKLGHYDDTEDRRCIAIFSSWITSLTNDTNSCNKLLTILMAVGGTNLRGEYLQQKRLLFRRCNGSGHGRRACTRGIITNEVEMVRTTMEIRQECTRIKQARSALRSFEDDCNTVQQPSRPSIWIRRTHSPCQNHPKTVPYSVMASRPKIGNVGITLALELYAGAWGPVTKEI